MILLISTCEHKLSEEEFVKPVADILDNDCRIINYKDVNLSYLGKYQKIIICGTALKDNFYLENISCFDWIKKTNIPVLGICSGMQAIALQFNSKLAKSKETGMICIKTLKQNPLFSGEFFGYALHGNGLNLSSEFEALAESDKCVQAIKHKEKNIYGTMFHPEARNKEIIKRFSEL